MNELRKTNEKKEGGITLLALVITIVILIILATIAIQYVFGENGLISNAKKAKEEYVHGTVKESFTLKQGDYTIDKTKGNEKDFIEYIKSDDGNNILNSNNEVNVPNLVGKKLDLGNGTNKSDVYMVESADEITYYLRYYDKDGVSRDLLEFKVDSTTGDTDSGDNIDWDEVLDNAEKHPEQSETNNDIGIGTDGKPVNMDLWNSVKTEDGLGYDLRGDVGCFSYSGYKGEIIDGKIQGAVPQYIKKETDDKFYPVKCMTLTFVSCNDLYQAPDLPDTILDMDRTFYYCSGLVEVPEIPSSVTNMSGTFIECTSLTRGPKIPSSVTNMNSTFYRCSSLVQAPEIPSSVTNMNNTFYGCSSLVQAPEIPSNVTNMDSTFYRCRSLTKAPNIPYEVENMQGTFWGCENLIQPPECIPSTVTNMYYTFYGCNSLTGTITIDANPNLYEGCFSGAALKEGTNLILTGASTMLETLKNTASSYSNISIQ